MKQKSRGNSETVITSASVSKYFNDIMKKYNFSPTEVFRRGVAVMLFDAGEQGYQTELNKARSDNIKPFLKSVEEYEKLKKQIETKLKNG